MNNVIPAIISENISGISEKMKEVEDLVSWVQIDVMDGVFVPPLTWYSPEELKDIETKLKIEVHLMVKNPESRLSEWVDAGVDRVIVHAEATSHMSLRHIVERLKEKDVEVGVSLKLETDIREIEDLIPDLDVVQFMSIDEIGYYGRSFDARVIPKIVSLRERFPDVKISVDGGVDILNAKELLKAGVDNLCVGSGVFKSNDVAKSIKQLQSI